MFFLRRWGHRQLLTSWLVYWAGLLGVLAGPAFAEWWRLQRADAHGSVSVNVTAGALEMALWLAGPPLVIGLLWLAVRPPRGAAAKEAPPRPLAEGSSVDEAALWERQRREREARQRDERG